MANRVELPEGLEGLAVIRFETNDVVVFRERVDGHHFSRVEIDMLRRMLKVPVFVLPHGTTMEIVQQGDIASTDGWKVCVTCGWGGDMPSSPRYPAAPHGTCRQCGSRLQPGEAPPDRAK